MYMYMYVCRFFVLVIILYTNTLICRLDVAEVLCKTLNKPSKSGFLQIKLVQNNIDMHNHTNLKPIFNVLKVQCSCLIYCTCVFSLCGALF